MATREFRLPDLGEGLTESELVEWHVSVGDTVTLNQTIADVETAKAVVQLPSPVAGVVTELCAEPGETVQVGTPIVRFEVAGGDAAPASVPDAPAASASSAEPAAAAPAEPERQSVLVGYGPAAASGRAPARKARKGAFQPAAASIPAAPATVATATANPSATAAGTRTLATPPVRKLAHTLGVDLAQLAGSGPHGLVTRDDVQHAASAPSAPSAPGAPGAGDRATSAPAPGRAGFPAERRTPIKGVRKATAQAMVESAFTAPHASVFLTVDVTRTMKLVKRLTEVGDRASLLAVISKAVCLAAAAQPALNSHWDDDASEIVEWGHVNLGIAVAAPRGLMVPVVHGAHEKTVAELTDAIAELARTARAGELSPQQLSGGTITISNVGVFGIDAGTPILVPGQAAILATGAVQRRPWEHRGRIRLRDVMTLSLSFDHRLVDGEQGARFLTDVGRTLSDPATVLGRV
ncbi:dihydrolipoamide acetyltransferase family protein [Microcella sp.]|uniref:dihydrolipoamide acetyltransferase family protein n=1 Tax=Microcella sp. TaxID=1913979 RepID=UPI00391D8912